MKKISVTLEDTTRILPPSIQTLLDSTDVQRIEKLAWEASSAPVQVLYYFHAPKQRIYSGLDGELPTEEWLLTESDAGTFGIITHQRSSMGVLNHIGCTKQIIELPPVVYNSDSSIEIGFAGAEESFEQLLKALQEDFDLEVQGYGQYHGPRGWDRVTPRQYEALTAAVEVGYFDNPKMGTMVDVADRIGCSESTASEHVRKAQSAVIKDFTTQR